MGKTAYLKEVSLLFLRIGATAFGGPAAYIAIMQRETVRRRGWLDDNGFLDLVGATNLIPGPNATEMALYLGLVRAGWSGYAASGLLFIIPGMLATMVLAWVYVAYGSLPQVGWVLYGVKPIVIAIVIQALWDLGRKGVKGPLTAVVGAAVIAGYLLGFNEIALLFAGAAAVLLFYGGWRLLKRGLSALLVLPMLRVPLPWLPSGAVPFTQTALFLTFLKIGAVLYGSGYVLLAFFNSEFVVRLGWLTHQQLLDAIAVGQVTPGPVSTQCYLRWLPDGRLALGAAGDPGFLSAVVFLRRPGQPRPPLAPEVVVVRSLPGWREYCVTRSYGGSHLAARAFRSGGLVYHIANHHRPAAGIPLQGQFSLADTGWGFAGNYL